MKPKQNKTMNDNIPFCDKRVYLANHMIPDITRNLNRFPLITQEYRVVENMRDLNVNDPHLVTINMTKDKYILFLTTIKNRQYCLFINQTNNQYFYCKFRFDMELYSGTLFTGEFFKNDKDSWSYYIEDIHYLESKSMERIPFSKRLENIYNTLKSRYTWDEMMNICHLEIKPYFTYNYLEKIRECNYISNLYFIPELFADPVKIINLKSVINVDTPELDQGYKILTFRTTDQPDIYTLTDDTNVDHGIASIKTLEQSKFVRNFLKDNKFYKTKCKYNSTFKKWTLA
jgi:hypothetical protein